MGRKHSKRRNTLRKVVKRRNTKRRNTLRKLVKRRNTKRKNNKNTIKSLNGYKIIKQLNTYKNSMICGISTWKGSWRDPGSLRGGIERPRRLKKGDKRINKTPKRETGESNGRKALRPGAQMVIKSSKNRPQMVSKMMSKGSPIKLIIVIQLLYDF